MLSKWQWRVAYAPEDDGKGSGGAAAGGEGSGSGDKGKGGDGGSGSGVDAAEFERLKSAHAKTQAELDAAKKAADDAKDRDRKKKAEKDGKLADEYEKLLKEKKEQESELATFRKQAQERIDGMVKALPKQAQDYVEKFRDSMTATKFAEFVEGAAGMFKKDESSDGDDKDKGVKGKTPPSTGTGIRSGSVGHKDGYEASEAANEIIDEFIMDGDAIKERLRKLTVEVENGEGKFYYPVKEMWKEMQAPEVGLGKKSRKQELA
jgi:hypothetical protein